MAIVELHNVKFNYPDKKMIFGSFDLQIETGDLVFLMGANGSGKSTLLKLILGANIPSDGTVVIDGARDLSTKKRTSKVAYVPQDKGLDPEMNATDVFDFIASAHGLNRARRTERKNYIYQALGLDEIKEKRIKYLSGGQRQLINIGIALLHDPEILLLDEPFVGLDYGSKSNIIALLRSLNKSVLCITHDIDFAESNADKILLLEKGRILEYEPPVDLVQSNPYYIAELDFKEGNMPKVQFSEEIESHVQFNRLVLSTKYEEARVTEIVNYMTAHKEQIASLKTFERNLKSTLVGKYRMSFAEGKGKQKKKGKNK